MVVPAGRSEFDMAACFATGFFACASGFDVACVAVRVVFLAIHGIP
jgi:hypothetical protein